MKRILVIILLLFALPALANQQAILCSSGSGPAASSCTPAGTPTNSNETVNSWVTIGSSDANYYKGFIVETGESTVDTCTIHFSLREAAGDISSKNFRVEVWSLTEVDGDLDTQLSVTGTINGGSWGTGTWVTLTIPASQNVLADYAVVVTMNEIDASNYAGLNIQNSNVDSYCHYGRWDSSGVNQDSSVLWDVGYRQYAVSP